VVGTIAAYWPLKDCAFTNFDDPEYVTKNPHVFRGLNVQSITWAFTQIHSSNWHPLTWISHMLDCQIFGTKPAGHHFTSLGFHIANTLLLFWLLFKMTGSPLRSGIVAALFAWHPLHVESVAWISERKDVLSTFFGLLAMLAYAYYVQRKAEGGEDKPNVPRSRHLAFYVLSLFLFALSLLSKSMLVTLPFVLLLIDFWPLRRWDFRRAGLSLLRTRVLLEKIPFFVLSIAFSAATFYVQKKGGAVISLEFKPLSERIVNALHSYVGYLEKLVWPTQLCAYYFNQWQDSRWVVYLATLLVLSAVAIWSARRWRFVPVGWLWYVGTLLPVIGIVQVGSQAMADRYTYFPSIGIFVAVVWVAAEILSRYSRWLTGLISAAILLVFAVATWFQVHRWQNSIALFEHALQVGEESAVAHQNLGYALLEDQGRAREAERHFRRALEMYPDYPEAHFCLGNCLHIENRLDEAEAQYRVALRLKPNYERAHYSLANVLALKGRVDEAMKNFNEALRVKPDYGEAYMKRGNLLLMQRDRKSGMSDLRKAVELLPANAEAHYYLGAGLAEEKKFQDAIVHFYAAIQLRPDYVEALNDLAWVLAAEPAAPHNPAEAVRLAKKACEPKREPRYLDTLAVAYAVNGQTNAARTICQEALNLAIATTNAALAKHLEAQLEKWSKTP
jgi:tetratricopeptide (TPR) repeat protein